MLRRNQLLVAATLALLPLPWCLLSPFTAWAHGATRAVVYKGYKIDVPATWPVYDLAADPTVCVRFDRHALYLGRPGSEQRCPAHAVGRTEAILLEPMTVRRSRLRSAAGAPLPGVSQSLAQRGRGNLGELAIPSRGIVATATWAAQPRVLERALGIRSLSAIVAPVVSPGRIAAVGPRSHRLAAHTAAVDTGLGFDVCSAPSTAAMSAWSSSPYRAIGIYLGGANMGCSQPNLSAGWVGAETSAGWHLIPTYVGLQAPTSQCGCSTINRDRASAEGTAAASDAVSQAQALGIAAGNPIYFDMEAYSRSPPSTSAVLTFLSAWTFQLHAAGYLSGVYSSASSGISDLVNAVGSSYVEPDDIWIADWNGQHTTSDSYVPAYDWSSNQRLHQYDGGHDETHGGVRLNIDGDYLDGATVGSAVPTTGGPPPDGTFVQVPGSGAVYVIAGGAPLFVSSWNAFGGPRQFTSISQQQFDALNPVPVNGTFLLTTTGAIYRVAGGAPIGVSSWSIFGGVQPSVTVDEWDITNLSNPSAHLNSMPSDGTVVEGLPSHSYWSFAGGYRSPTGASASAVMVDDAGLAAFPVLAPKPPPPRSSCVVPGLRHMKLRAARHALRRAHCRLGRVHRPRHARRRKALRVIRQSVAPGTTHPLNYTVNIRLF